ncbi:hypothetical protein AZE42_12087 [Rhizopogon vesiculosus]|uniref:Uncharacterized protein n=1 Tax=Rhizopogon vesiculosus TaxID=180088 RepID=A0A1J8QLU8_9AGAM|nr:hypothetical protein AZE42_12087 [Rhizopogon vesiculosus]
MHGTSRSLRPLLSEHCKGTASHGNVCLELPWNATKTSVTAINCLLLSIFALISSFLSMNQPVIDLQQSAEWLGLQSVHVHVAMIILSVGKDGILHLDVQDHSYTSASFNGFIDGLLDNMNPFPQTNSVIVMDNVFTSRLILKK